MTPGESQGKSVVLEDNEGVRVAAEVLAGAEDTWLLKLESDRTLSIPKDTLVPKENGDYNLLLSLSELESQAEGQPAPIPVLEETLEVHKRQVETARVRVKKVVHEREEVVDEALYGEQVEIRRVGVGRVVEQAGPVRHEGETTIIPLYEEVLVVEKRLFLREELHITRKVTERREPQRVTLRSEEAVVERFPREEESQSS